MEDFEKKVKGDVLIEVVNLTRATLAEAVEFKQILKDDIEKRFKKIVVDLSTCEFMDSTFLGTLVWAQKNVTIIGGEIRLVKPISVFQTLMEKAGTLKIFDIYKSVEEAVIAFNYSLQGEVPLPINA
jgi:anti-anti-sigma factor